MAYIWISLHTMNAGATLEVIEAKVLMIIKKIIIVSLYDSYFSFFTVLANERQQMKVLFIQLNKFQALELHET